MNKLFIGLLIVAAGAGVFFLLSKKKNKTAVAAINKELIIGKWKTASSLLAKDSALPIYQYNFLKDGNIIKSLNDSAKTDTSYYEWSKPNELVWKENASDSIGNIYGVVKLTTDSLQMQTKDSSIILFTKLK